MARQDEVIPSSDPPSGPVPDRGPDPAADSAPVSAAGPDEQSLSHAGEESVAAAPPLTPCAAAVGIQLDAAPFVLPDLGAERDQPKGERNSIELIQDVELRVKIELGRTRMYVEDVLRLGDGSVVELDKPAGDPVDVFVNDRLVARGEVLVLNDNLCVRIGAIVSEADLRQAG